MTHDDSTASVEDVRELVQRRLDVFVRHRYFDTCRELTLSRAAALKIVEQLFCMSTFFVRVLARRLAALPSDASPALVEASREHLIEEIGHPDLFLRCLRENGASEQQLADIAPTCWLKALFGYLIVTIEYERQQVATIALFQVMEGAALHYFTQTMELMRRNGLQVQAVAEHVEHDAGHAEIGLDPTMRFDAKTMSDIQRVTNDLCELIEAVLDHLLETVAAHP